MIGSSRFTGHDTDNSVIEVGYTFLARECWGKGQNRELKNLMLGHAFEFVEKVQFYIGQKNLRSRRAVEKLGALLMRIEARTSMQGNPYNSVMYEITKQAWHEMALVHAVVESPKEHSNERSMSR